MDDTIKNQKDAVMRFFDENDVITSQDAIHRLGITRLANVIYRLKKEGVKIETTYEYVNTMYGKSRYAIYRIVR